MLMERVVIKGKHAYFELVWADLKALERENVG